MKLGTGSFQMVQIARCDNQETKPWIIFLKEVVCFLKRTVFSYFLTAWHYVCWGTVQKTTWCSNRNSKQEALDVI